MACSFSLGVLYLLTNVSSLNIFWVLIGTLGGMIGGSDLPILYLNSRIRSRQRIIRQELPELMLLLETGNKGRIATLGIFANIYEHWDSILGNTMGKIVKMTQLGTSLEHSINKVATDLDVPEFYKLCSGILQFQDNHDSLASFMASLREQFYQNEELEIQNKTKPYRLWHNFAYRYILWIGLVFWLLAPIITS